MVQDISSRKYIADMQTIPLIPNTILVISVKGESKCRILKILKISKDNNPLVSYVWIEDGDPDTLYSSAHRMDDIRTYMASNDTDVLYHLCKNILGDFPRKEV